MAELLVLRKKDSNLIVRVLKRKNDFWDPESFGSSGKDCNFEAVIKNKDPNLLGILLYDLQSQGFNVQKAIAKFKDLAEKPDLFFLR